MTFSLSTTLVGGLGNRLFQLCALTYFTSILRVEEVEVRVGRHELLSLQNKLDLSSLLGFKLTSDIEDSPRIQLKEVPCRNGERSNSVTIQRLRSTLTHRLMLREDPSPGQSTLTFNHSSGRTQVVLSGFAQCRRLVSASQLIGFPKNLPSLEERSKQFDELASFIRNAGFTLAVHVRGGDYRKSFNKRRIGLLPREYFSNAIELASEMQQIDQVVVFTDDVDYANYTVPNTRLPTRLIGDQETSAAEALSLMSLCNGLVISNSTLSWWAAEWAVSGTSVYAPSPWYRGLTVDLLQDSWTPLPSYFGKE